LLCCQHTVAVLLHTLFFHTRHHFFPFLLLLRLEIAAAFDFASALLLAPHARSDNNNRVGLPFFLSGPLMLPIRARKLALLGLSPFFTGAFSLPPLYDARPLAFKPPLGFLPALRCHAGVLAICQCSHTIYQTSSPVGNLSIPPRVYHFICCFVPVSSIYPSLHTFELG